MRNTSGIGDIAEGAAIAFFLKKGYSVSIPFGNQAYDLILDKENSLYRLQCKTGWLKDGAITFNSASVDRMTGKRKGYAGRADGLIVYYPPDDQLFWVPIDVCTPCGVTSLRVDPIKVVFKKTKWAKDYLLG